MRTFLGFVIALILAGGVGHAADENSFLKTGALYYAWAAKDSPVPFQPTHSGNGSTATVKIIQYGVNQWYWVEYDVFDIPAQRSAAVTIYKKRRWLNFAQTLALEPAEEPNYAQMYPQGYKIVPYDGPGP